MPFIAGILSGILLTVLTVFLVDHISVAGRPAGAATQKIVNWDVAAERVRSSVASITQEVREDVHQATR